MKGCLILFGESFRLGGQGNRNIGNIESYTEQINAINSQIFLLKSLNNKNVAMDVYISSYETIFTKDIIDLYNNYLIGYEFYKNLLGQETLIHNSIYNIKNITNISKYNFLLCMRIDLFIKDKFIEIFNYNSNKILWPSICFKPHHKCGIHPRVNDMMIYIPNNHFNYFNYLNFLNHDQWKYLIEHTNLSYDDLDTMINTFHDSDSSKDYNPLYYIVNRPQMMIHHTMNETFDKNNFI